MKIVIVGAGAMGCLFAGLLARAGHELILFEKNPDRVHAIRCSGISIEQDGGGIQAPMAAVYSDIAPAGTADLLLLLVKAYDTGHAVQACLPAIGPATTVLTLQNGLGNIEAISRYVPQSQILAGTTAQGATLLGHGRVRYAGQGETVIGALAPEAISRAEAVRDVFRNCGIPTVVSSHITAALWTKLLVNAGINALTAILQIQNGMVGSQEQVHAVMRRAVLEGAEIAARLGIELPYPDPLARTEDVCRATGANISSMLQDIRAGRRTEIDSINGMIASHGRQLGIATPVNSLLTCLVKSMGFSGAS